MNIRMRHDQLISLLRRKRNTTIDEISSHLETSRRTVLRDIACLREQGFIINSSSGPGGGLSLVPTSILVTPKLTSSEVFSLLITYAVLKETHNIPFLQLAEAGLTKIEQSLPPSRIQELREIFNSVYIGRPNPALPTTLVSEINKNVLEIFETCFLTSKTMALNYIDRHEISTKRTIEPHAIFILSPAWYIVGYDTQKNAFRHFRMDRIQNATSEENVFRRRPFKLQNASCPFKTMSFN